MAKENRMTREEFLEECEKVEDTAYAEKGHPQTFGNELLLQNIDAFYEAFNIQEADNMYLAPEKRVKIW